MKLLITSCVLSLTWLVVADDYKVVCYFRSEAISRVGNGKIEISYLDPNLCTHMIYSFVGISESGQVQSSNPATDLGEDGGQDGIRKFNVLRERNPTMKTLVAVGGPNQESALFSRIASNATMRRTFLKSAFDFVTLYGFDGFELDWQFPGQKGGVPKDKANFITLLRALRTTLKKKKYLLSVAVAGPETYANDSYDIPKLTKLVDLVNLMAYDLHHSDEPITGQSAPLFGSKKETPITARYLNVDAVVQYWLAKGATPQKLMLGMAFHGRSFILRKSSDHDIGSPVSGPGYGGPYTHEAGMLAYNEICESQKMDAWNVEWDDEQKVPYAYRNDEWVGYDNVRSITEKANYLKTKGLGGAMVWSIENDDFRSVCGPRFLLLQTINNVLRKTDYNGVETVII